MASRKTSVNFAFGMFDIEGGFAVSHQYDRNLGVVRPGDPVTIRVTTVPEYTAVTAYAIDGDGPYSSTELRTNGRPLHLFRSGDAWIGTLPGQPDDTVTHYIVEAEHRSGAVHYGDGRLPLENARVFAHRTTNRRPPIWTDDAVVYQIFVDRFANAEGPVLTPDVERTWAGGNLQGVEANLDWLEHLGVNCIWLTPVFTCFSYHGYDTVDMMSIDPRFGGDAALRSLIDKAHERGIRILLDLVPNHISNEHPWFTSAQTGGPERDWFFIDDDGSYLMFFTSHTMPKVNLDHPDARAAMLDVAAYWVEEFGIDGYRIDHALGPSESFFAALSKRIEAISPDIWLFGEVTATAQLSRRYGGVLDGVTDFPYAYGVRELLAGRLDPEEFAELERESAAAVPMEDFTWVRFFDNHDMGRAIHSWDNDTQRLTKGLEILFGLPGVPSFFYGTEQALTHDTSEADGGMSVGRVGMTFNEDDPMFAVTSEIVARRALGDATPATPLFWKDDAKAWTWGDHSGSM